MGIYPDRFVQRFCNHGFKTQEDDINDFLSKNPEYRIVAMSHEKTPTSPWTVLVYFERIDLGK